MARRSSAVAWLLAAALVSPAALAQSEADKTTARKLFIEAREALEAKDYARASEGFARSNALYPAPTAALGLSRALAAQGKLVGAYEALTAALARGLTADASPAFKQALLDAGRERDALEPRLASVVVRVRGPQTPDVTLDEAPLRAAALGVARLADPGPHALAVRAEGFQPHTQSFELAEGEVRTLDIELRPSVVPAAPPAPRRAGAARPAPRPDAPPAGLRTAGFVLGGLGVASLAVSAVSGALYLSAKATADGSCAEGPGAGTFTCADSAGRDAASRARTFGWINAVTLVGGVAVMGVGVALVVVGSGSARVEARAHPGGATLGGRF